MITRNLMGHVEYNQTQIFGFILRLYGRKGWFTFTSHWHKDYVYLGEHSFTRLNNGFWVIEPYRPLKNLGVPKGKPKRKASK